METLIKDLRYGVRSFLKRPGFLFIAISTLALGIGATTAMFTVVNSVLLRPLNFPEPERIVLFDGNQSAAGNYRKQHVRARLRRLADAEPVVRTNRGICFRRRVSQHW